MTKPTPHFQRVPTKLIDPSPFNIRKEKHPAELAGSMRERKRGVLSPLRVRPKGKRFENVYGDRRLAEAKALGLKELDVVIVDVDDKEALIQHVIENCVRRDFNAIEEADAFRRLKKIGYSGVGLAKLLKKSPAHIANRLALLKLPAAVQGYVIAGTIGAVLAQRISQSVPPDIQEKVAETIVSKKYDYWKAAAYVRSLEKTFKLEHARAPFALPPTKDHLEAKRLAVEEKLREAFGVDAVEVSTLKFWRLLLRAEPRFQMYKIRVDKDELADALSEDLRKLREPKQALPSIKTT